MRLANTITLLLLIGMSTMPAPAQETSAKMTDAERSKAIQLLKDSQKEFLASVEKLTDAQWNYKSPPINGRERWSIAETSEHIMLSEELIFSRVNAALAAPVVPDWEAKTGKKTEMLMRVLVDRSGKATAPEAIQPKSKLTRAEIIAKYKETYAKVLKFAETTDADLKNHTSDNPFFGPLNAYQWLIYVPLHNLRHNMQIAEVKTYEGYPK